MGKSKYYVVWKGKKPGIYSTWEDCQAQINNYKGAVYKSYTSMSEAKQAYTSTPNTMSAAIEPNSVCVDAACSGNPGVVEYRCVETVSKKELFLCGPYPEGTNNIGEFLGLVHILALLDQKQRHDVIVYTDSMTAMAWVRNKKAKSTLVENKVNKELLALVTRAEGWLAKHPVKNKILKWDTVKWGEIPADFGRK